MRHIRKNSVYDVYCISRYQFSAIRTMGAVSIAQLVEVTGSAVLGGVVEVVSSVRTVGQI